jgi:hypothetical protein
MSTTAAALTVAAVLGFSLPAAYWQIRRAMAEESARDRIIREAHQRARTAAALDPITLTQPGPGDFLETDPELAVRFAHLRQAIRDQQQEDQ